MSVRGGEADSRSTRKTQPRHRPLPTSRERSGDWLKLNAKQFGRLRACGRRRGRAAIRKEKRRPAWLAWYAAPSAAAWTDQLFREGISGHALRESAVQPRLHRDDVDCVLPVGGEVDDARVLVDAEIIPHPSCNN